MVVHPTVHVSLGKLEADVDVELADLILEMWTAGIETLDCCQDVGEATLALASQLPHLTEGVARRDTGRASIGFRDPDPLLDFYEALANAGPRDVFYERMVHWAAPGAWSCITVVHDWGLDEGDGTFAPDDTPSSRFAATGIQVRFPLTDAPEMVRRMRRHNGGEAVSLGLPSWESVSTLEG